MISHSLETGEAFIPLQQVFNTLLAVGFRVEYLDPEHGLRAENLELLLRVGVVVSLVALKRGLLLGQRTRLLVQAGVDNIRAFLSRANGRGLSLGGAGRGGGVYLS